MSPKIRTNRAMRALAVAVTAASLSGGVLVAVASSANAASDPLPWMSTETSSGEQVGTLSFYDSSGNQIFTGSTTTEPMAAYAVASGGLIQGSSDAYGATAYLYTPTASDPALWGNTQISSTAALGPGQNASYTALPASIRNSDQEVVPLALSVTDHTTQYPSSYDAPNDKVYEVRVIGATDQKWYSADIEIDPATSTWTQVYPAQTIATSFSGFKATPSSPAPAGTTAVTLTAALTAADSSVPTGSVHLFDGANDLGAVTPDSDGQVSKKVTGLKNGSSHTFQFKFTGTGSYSDSQTSTMIYKIKSPDATALTISKATKIAYGKTVTITGSIKDSTTGKALGATSVALYGKPTGSSSYAKLKTVKSSSTGALSAVGVKPTKTTNYEWRYTATAAHKSATSANDVVTVTRTATIAAASKTVTRGKSTKIYGVVAPVAGGTATVQRKSGTKWIEANTGAIKKQKLPNGKTAIGYVVTRKFTSKGKFTFRVSTPSVTGYGAATPASTVTITVK